MYKRIIDTLASAVRVGDHVCYGATLWTVSQSESDDYGWVTLTLTRKHRESVEVGFFADDPVGVATV